MVSDGGEFEGDVAYINTSKQAFAVDMTAGGFTMGSIYKEAAEDGR